MSKTKVITMRGGEKTILTRANSSSYSLRTTVPKGVVSHFGLKEGDSLLWVIQPDPSGKDLMLIVEKDGGKKGKKK